MLKLSFGYEFETDDLSFSNSFQDPTHHIHKCRLDKRTHVYEDRLSVLGEERVHDFCVRQQRGNNNYELQTSDYVVDIDRSLLRVDKLFNDAEFIVTHPEITPTRPQDVAVVFFKQFRKACRHLRKVFTAFHPSTIENKDFPYRDIFKHGVKPFYLLSHNQDQMLEDVVFVPQCTIGVQMDKAKVLLDSLYQFWYWETGEECPIYARSTDACENILHPSDPKKLHDYFFLFAYSYMSRRHRKKRRVFLFRNLFSEICREYLKDKEIRLLDERFRVHLHNHPQSAYHRFYDYFQKTHLFSTARSTRTREQIQRLAETTLIFEEGRFFIEYRGLNNLIKPYLPDNQFTIRSFMSVPSKTLPFATTTATTKTTR